MTIKSKDKISIIGKYSGECADATVTNENGLDITREVWENVFSSDIYKQALENGWYIGYLGHPEDPNCMDFKNACIVMTECHIDDDGKVYGEFNLIDTPVGRIVKSFTDSGVTFGISVRGAGDIIDHSVDPETFVFRGFDLVTFPAFKDAIPTFQEIAASTDTKAVNNYKKVCASVNKELENITSCQTLETLKEQFPKQSHTYQNLQSRKNVLQNEDIEEVEDIKDTKIKCLTDLFLREKDKTKKLTDELNKYKENSYKENIKTSKYLARLNRIVANQTKTVNEIENDVYAELDEIKNKNAILQSTNIKLKQQANELKQEVKAVKSKNLQYSMKIEASESTLKAKDDIVDKLNKKLDKTVIEASKAAENASNLDEELSSQADKILASQRLIEGYQDAYASLYSQVIGVNLNNVSVDASTSVEDLQKKILASSNVSTVDEDLSVSTVDLADDSDNLITA